MLRQSSSAEVQKLCSHNEVLFRAHSHGFMFDVEQGMKWPGYKCIGRRQGWPGNEGSSVGSGVTSTSSH